MQSKIIVTDGTVLNQDRCDTCRFVELDNCSWIDGNIMLHCGYSPGSFDMLSAAFRNAGCSKWESPEIITVMNKVQKKEFLNVVGCILVPIVIVFLVGVIHSINR